MIDDFTKKSIPNIEWRDWTPAWAIVIGLAMILALIGLIAWII